MSKVTYGSTSSQENAFLKKFFSITQRNVNSINALPETVRYVTLEKEDMNMRHLYFGQSASKNVPAHFLKTLQKH